MTQYVLAFGRAELLIKVFRIFRSLSEKYETQKKRKYHAAAGQLAKQFLPDNLQSAINKIGTNALPSR